MRIGIIGGGNMGEAIIAGTYRTHTILVCEANAARARYLRNKYRVTTADLETVVKKSGVIILAVKPQDMSAVLGQMKACTYGKLVISIAAGLTTKFFEKHFPGRRLTLVRCMPNMPALIGEGITALCAGKYATATDLKAAQKILQNVGRTVIVKESMIDAVTAVSGSGPAYVFLFVECLINAARRLGFKEAQAKELVYQTLVGSAHLLLKSKDDAATLRAKVTSKGGTTQAAMDVFMARRIQDIFITALQAAKKRAAQLAK